MEGQTEVYDWGVGEEGGSEVVREDGVGVCPCEQAGMGAGDEVVGGPWGQEGRSEMLFHSEWGEGGEDCALPVNSRHSCPEA